MSIPRTDTPGRAPGQHQVRICKRNLLNDATGGQVLLQVAPSRVERHEVSSTHLGDVVAVLGR